MRQRFSDAWTRTVSEAKQLIFGNAPWGVFAALGGIGALFGAFFFAIHDFGKVNVIVSFVVGFVTSCLYLALLAGPLALWMFLTILLSFLSGQASPSLRAQTISAIAAAIVVLAMWIAVVDFLSGVPVLGRQLTFMLRDD
jgi:hypothetical protein